MSNFNTQYDLVRIKKTKQDPLGQRTTKNQISPDVRLMVSLWGNGMIESMKEKL